MKHRSKIGSRIGEGTDERSGAIRVVPPLRVPRPEPMVAADSPAIGRLRRRLADQEPGAVAEFWARVSAEGTPLVEPLAGRHDKCVVTFLWRPDNPGVRTVVVHVNKMTDYNNLSSSQLRPLPDSDIWFASFEFPADWRGSYRFSEHTDPVPNVTTRPAFTAVLRTDPLNRNPLPDIESGPARSVAELPKAPAQPWWRHDRRVAAGVVRTTEFHSDSLGNRRTVSVYEPPGYRPSSGSNPVLVMLDGGFWTRSIPLRHTLDNLIAAGRIPPMMAVLPDAIDLETRRRELCCRPEFVRFLADELLPWVGDNWPVSANPVHTVVAGQSLGGLTAVYAGHTRPDRFGHTISQSGSFWWPGPAGDHPEWLTDHIAANKPSASPRPARHYLEVGTQEWALLEPTRRIAQLLRATGTLTEHHEFNGGHDYACWRGGIATALTTLTATRR